VIGLDTSVVIRYLIGRPAAQAASAAAVIDGPDELGISVVVLLETAHVLRTQYGVARADLLPALIELLTREDVRILGLSRERAIEALVRARSLPGTPIADALIAAMAREAEAIPLYAFDRGMARHGVEVRVPGQADRA
jgi:predicted nucleic acid-binding protein